MPYVDIWTTRGEGEDEREVKVEVDYYVTYGGSPGSYSDPPEAAEWEPRKVWVDDKEVDWNKDLSQHEQERIEIAVQEAVVEDDGDY